MRVYVWDRCSSVVTYGMAASFTVVVGCRAGSVVSAICAFGGWEGSRRTEEWIRGRGKKQNSLRRVTGTGKSEHTLSSVSIAAHDVRSGSSLPTAAENTSSLERMDEMFMM